MKPQPVAFWLAQSQERRVVRNDPAEAGGDDFQQVSQVKDGDHGVVDFQQQPRPIQGIFYQLPVSGESVRAKLHGSTFTPFQKATWPLICFAASFASG